MKSPAELSERWARQWDLADNREQRLLSAEAWPVSLSIGKPCPTQFTRHTQGVREHLDRWRAVTIGRVMWEQVNFRTGSEPVDVPIKWILRNPSEWVAACGDPAVHEEFGRLNRLVSVVDPLFHRSVVRQRYLLQDKPEAEITRAADLALALEPGCASGRPLRAISVCGIDSKFFERHRSLLTHLLDVRFEGQVSELGLEWFLDALDEGEHWLLVAPLAPSLLPFVQQRVRAAELASTPLPASHILIVENERCLHQLPPLANTVAILGAGLNLEWMDAQWLREKRIAYWGDMDTWGLAMLAKAGSRQPHLRPLLMSRELFDASHSTLSVVETRSAGEQPPGGLTPIEESFYRYLQKSERGRVEQEFLPHEWVVAAAEKWRYADGNVVLA
jgi:hypothetical protein